MYTGPNGLQAANYLTDSLKANGVEMFRFKTGTPARIDKTSRSIFRRWKSRKGMRELFRFLSPLIRKVDSERSGILLADLYQ